MGFVGSGVALGAVRRAGGPLGAHALGSNVSETVLVKDRHELVTSAGPYRWVRHPLYTTGIALFIAIGLMAANWFILALAVDRADSDPNGGGAARGAGADRAFGAGYQEYRKRTGAMMPRFRSG